MTSLSVRRVIPVCVALVAVVVSMVAAGTASATSDLGTDPQCLSGVTIKGNGSSFQAPILVKWATDFNKINGIANKNPFACGGTQGLLGEPKVEYLSGGSGACLHGWGAESTEPVKFAEFPFCGTDEAPNPKQKFEMESHATGGEANALETIPVLQGAVAAIVHLPANCLAQSEITKSGKKYKLGRLVLDDSSIEGVYAGTIRNWKQLLANQKAGSDSLTCKGGAKGIKIFNAKEEEEEVAEATAAQEEEEVISPVVRLDHSGTTHIFKAFLLQIGGETKIKMEAYPEVLPEGRGNTGCKESFLEEEKTWAQVSEGCQNQRWPAAAKVVFGTEKGNPGVVKRVNERASSIGYADLAVAREFHYFSGLSELVKGKKVWTIRGGENTKGTETKVGEQNHEFWAEIQDTKTPEATGYAEPASNGDIEKPANSNCGTTVYSNEAGKKFPPSSTREPWNQAKAELVQKEYSICGLTYDLALRQYKYYGVSKEAATTVRDFLHWALNTKTEGGGSVEKNTDYEKLPTSVIEEGEDGLEEVGFEEPGLAK